MFAGLGVMVILLPLNGFITMKIGKYQKEQMEQKDSRLKLMNEILNGIKVNNRHFPKPNLWWNIAPFTF